MEGAANSVVTAMTTAISTIAGDALNGIAAIIPVAAPVLGGMILISVCIKTVKRFTNKG